MLRLDGRKFSRTFTLSLWYLMSFQAGYVNVGGFIIFGNFVSHVTGTSSQIGMGVGGVDLGQVVTFMTILLAFITGAAFSGYFLARRVELGKEPRYILVNFTKSVLFAIILIMSEAHFMTDETQNILLIIFLLSVCCGIQNSSCSIATNGFLKPTHMTGLSTDIGIHLTKVGAWRKGQSEKYHEEMKKNAIRGFILTFFILGGSIAYLIFHHNGHYGFLFPFISSLSLLIYSILIEQKTKRIQSKQA